MSKHFEDLNQQFWSEYINLESPESQLGDREVEAARRSLAAFGAAVHPDWKNNWHHYVMAEALEDVIRGVECGQYRQIVEQWGEASAQALAYRTAHPGVIERPVEPHHLIITLPAGAAKSEWGSCLAPAWALGQHPDWTVILSCYNSDRAEADGAKVRDIIDEEPVYRSIFPDVELDPAHKAAGKWKLKKSHARASMLSVGIGGSATGFRANCIIIDDPLKNPQEAASEATTESHWQWLTQVALKRLYPGAGALVVIMTRWSQNDLVGRILDKGLAGWRVLRVPGLAEEDESWTLRDGTVFERPEGEGLWPEWGMTREFFETSRAYDAQAFQAMDQGNPIPVGGIALKPEWLEAATEELWADSKAWPIVYGLDPSTGLGRDYSVIAKVRWEPATGRAVLAEIVRGKWGLSDLVLQLQAHAERDRPLKIVMESNAFQAMIATHIKTLTHLPIDKSPTKLSKGATHSAIGGTGFLFRTGQVKLPPERARDAGLHQFITEWAQFPRGRNDDTLDAVAKALEGTLLAMPVAPPKPVRLKFVRPAQGGRARPEERFVRMMQSRPQTGDLLLAAASPEAAQRVLDEAGGSLLGVAGQWVQRDGCYVARALYPEAASEALRAAGVTVTGRVA